ALDADTGEIILSFAANANSFVSALAVSTRLPIDPVVYVGGDFTSISGQPRNHIAALEATTGAATSWDPNADQQVIALALSGRPFHDPTTVYAGGFFNSIGGQPRINIAALDATTGAATSWDPNPGGSVWAIAHSGSAVLIGGWFSSACGKI